MGKVDKSLHVEDDGELDILALLEQVRMIEGDFAVAVCFGGRGGAGGGVRGGRFLEDGFEGC